MLALSLLGLSLFLPKETTEFIFKGQGKLVRRFASPQLPRKVKVFCKRDDMALMGWLDLDGRFKLVLSCIS